MKNNYEAPEVVPMSSVDSFVLGSKPWNHYEIDAIFGWGWWFFPFADDLDEGEN